MHLMMLQHFMDFETEIILKKKEKDVAILVIACKVWIEVKLIPLLILLFIYSLIHGSL